MTLKHCCNWKVLAGLGVVALGVLLVAPGLLGRVLPVLLVAICPLSMLAMVPMMARMNGGRQTRAPDGELDTPAMSETMPAAGAASCCGIAPPPRRLTTQTADLAALQAEASALAVHQDALAAEIARVEATTLPAGERV